MGIALGSITSALTGIKTHSRAFDKAAQKVTEASMAGLSLREAESVDGGDTFEGTIDFGGDLAGAMVDVLVAQRAHSASIQAMKVAHQMLREASELGETLA